METVRAGRSIPLVRRIAAPENLGRLLAGLILCMTPGSDPAAVGRATSAQASPEGDWLVGVSRDIARQEYEITWQERTRLGPAWQAPNRAQGFRMFFAGGQLIVVARTEEVPSWEWRMTLVRWGRGAAGTRVAPGGSMLAERVDANRIEIDRGTTRAASSMASRCGSLRTARERPARPHPSGSSWSRADRSLPSSRRTPARSTSSRCAAPA
jgi:hypothetical protein